jgi:hypothetical protein
MKGLTFAIPAFTLLITFAVCVQVVGSRTTSTPGITRRVMIDERTVQAVRSTYQPGTAEPPGPHMFDVVCVPLSPGRWKLQSLASVSPGN